MALLRAVVGDAPFVFVVGKGGVGKTTIAAALALEFGDDGVPVHLISTDPAHSLRDVFGNDAIASLTIEEFDAAAYSDAWLAHARQSLHELVERGTYLDDEDVAAFTGLALPGMDELMAALRLVDLAGSGRVIVDTAPTGHTLRLLDAADTHEGVARALRAMAEKAAVVASTFAGRAVRLRGEVLVDELEQYARRFRNDVLAPARFVVAARAGAMVEAETHRLHDALTGRGLHAVATVWTGPAPGARVNEACLTAPLLHHGPHGPARLRAWSAALAPCDRVTPPAASPPAASPAAPDSAIHWLEQRGPRFWLFAGKGGVGKTTCAAALAVALAETRSVLLCSADPAGSLADVLAAARAPGSESLRTQQIDPAAELARLRQVYRNQVMGTLESIGLSESAVLDRRVIDSLWDLAPPGIDEIAGLVAMLDAAESHETVVLDTAPTGHFLRLLGMPDLARDWTHQLMRMLVKYGAAGVDNGAAQALLRLARELRALHELLHDGQQAGIVLVTLAEPVVAAETDRLRARLRAQNLPIVATLVNRAPGQVPADGPTIYAPEIDPPPVGARALREFSTTWKIET